MENIINDNMIRSCLCFLWFGFFTMHVAFLAIALFSKTRAMISWAVLIGAFALGMSLIMLGIFISSWDCIVPGVVLLALTPFSYRLHKKLTDAEIKQKEIECRQRREATADAVVKKFKEENHRDYMPKS